MTDSHPKNVLPAPDTLPLFRSEALHRLGGSMWQPTLLSGTIPGSFLTAWSVTVVSIILLFASTQDFARKESVQGHLMPTEGWTQVRAKSAGVVQRVLVERGEAVQTGDVLVEVFGGDGLHDSFTVQEATLTQIGRRREVLQGQLELIDREHEHAKELLVHAKEADKKELASRNEEIKLAHTRLQIANQRLEGGRKLTSSGVMSFSALMDLREERQALLLSISERQREAERLRSDNARTESLLSRMAVQRDLKRAEIDKELLNLAITESRVQHQNISAVLAPRDGAVASVRVHSGDPVVPNRVMLDIVPQKAEMKARLFAPPSVMGFIELGQEVRVHVDAFTFENHGAQLGEIAMISETAMPADQPIMVPGLPNPVYRIDVRFPNGFSLPADQQRALRPGMSVTADLIRGYGTLVDWAMMPLRRTADRL